MIIKVYYPQSILNKQNDVEIYHLLQCEVFLLLSIRQILIGFIRILQITFQVRYLYAWNIWLCIKLILFVTVSILQKS
jgi:hypothetical protein